MLRNKFNRALIAFICLCPESINPRQMVRMDMDAHKGAGIYCLVKKLILTITNCQ